jgi:hypothetical protein
MVHCEAVEGWHVHPCWWRNQRNAGQTGALLCSSSLIIAADKSLEAVPIAFQ